MTKLKSRFALGLAALALALVPATAGAAGGPKGHAHGNHCKGESKEHVKGQKGTPFSRCVNAAAQADHAS